MSSIDKISKNMQYFEGMQQALDLIDEMVETFNDLAIEQPVFKYKSP